MAAAPLINVETARLHLGCGRDIREGWINLDCVDLPGVDAVADLDACATTPLPFEDDTFDEVFASHLLEHIRNPLPLMQELHRICREGAVANFRTPHGSHDDAFEDPTHYRQYFQNSYYFFSQPCYWRADYGYRGDWQPEEIVMCVDAKSYANTADEQIWWEINHMRNVVQEMKVRLRCIKPIREPKRDLMVEASVRIEKV
jgi:SAM-dependent methyltransferase